MDKLILKNYVTALLFSAVVVCAAAFFLLTKIEDPTPKTSDELISMMKEVCKDTGHMEAIVCGINYIEAECVLKKLDLKICGEIPRF